MPANQYDPTDATLRPANTAQEQVHTVTTVTTDRTIDVAVPVETVVLEDPPRLRKVDNGFAIW